MKRPTAHNRRIYGFAFGYAQISPYGETFIYPQNVIRNAVPKKDKKEGLENLKTEKVFIWKKSLPNNHSKKRDIQKGETLTTHDIMLFI